MTDERIEAVQPALTEEEFRVYCKGPDKRPRDVVLDAPLRMIAKATGWQGLTDEELMEILGYGKIERSPTRDFDFVDVIDVKLTRSLINAIEAKLKEKNT